MVFPAHETTAGLLLLAELSHEELAVLYPTEPAVRADLSRLHEEMAHVRRAGFAVNVGRSERGVAAIGVPVRHRGRAVAGLSVSMPTARYEKSRLAAVVSLLRAAARRTESDLGADDMSASVPPRRGGGGRGGGDGAWS
jgi:DNA-binding IclR family transcriptional regulator